MTQIRIKDAAVFLGVSDDTVRRWIENEVLSSSRDESGRTVVDGLQLAHLARKNAVLPSIRPRSDAPRATASWAWSPRSPWTR